MTFNVTLTQTPDVTHVFGTSSQWLMSQNPMIFKFQRKDLIVLGVSNFGSGETKITFTTSPYSLSAGDYIWWGDTSGISNGRYYVTSVNTANNFIIIQKQYGPHSLGWVNDVTNLQNYHVYLTLYKWLAPLLQGDTIARIQFYDDPTGLIVADLRKFLEPFLDLQLPIYFGIANKHEGRMQDFSFNYRPGFIHPTIDPELIVPNDFNKRYFAYKAAAQLGDEFGQNMRRYMTYPPVTPETEDAMMNFNSVFDEPYYFDGYPFLLSFVYSEKFTDNYIDRHIQWLDMNNNNVGAEKTDRIPSAIKENGCTISARGQLQFTDEANANHQDVAAFYLWLEDSETTVESGGGGGGTGTGTGSGGTDYSSFESDVFESDVYV